MSTNATRLHAMQLTYTIDGYNWCRQRKLPSIPSHKQMLYHLMIPMMTYTEIQAAGMMVVGVWVRKWRYGGRDRLDVSCFSLLFSLDLGPVQMASAWVFTTCQWWLSFPIRQIRRKVAIELYRSGVGLMGSYDCVRRTIVWLLPFILFSCTGFCGPGGLRLKRGIM